MVVVKDHQQREPSMGNITTIGLDLAKNVFQIHAVDQAGSVVMRKRPDVLAFLRSYEAEGKLETRDRVRSTGEKICNYADVEGDAYIPQPVAALFRLWQTPHLHAP
jgi:hypothetical protein